MKVLVTGALGHIGSQFIRDLPRLIPGVHVTLVDNLLTQRYCSLFNLPTGENHRFIEADILTCDLPALFRGMDVVVHLAAITDAANSFGNAAQIEEVNHTGTQKVAEACCQAGCPLIFLSTTSVYGTQDGEVDEDCPSAGLKPQSPYAESKLKTEQLLRQMGETAKLKSVVLRFGTIFGVSPGMRFHTAVNKFVWQATLGQPVTVWKTALHQVRPYLDLRDAVAALGFVIRKKLYPNTIFNVVTCNASVNDLLDCIREKIPSVTVQLVESRIMNQLSYRVRADKFQQQGFVFEGNLREGIHQSLELLRALRDGRDRP